MILIGEKINGAVPAVAKAIQSRNDEMIKDLARRQAEAGADYIDCCAPAEKNETADLCWLIECVQTVTDVPISLDSPSPTVLAEAYKHCKRPGLFNSLSGEACKQEVLLPLLSENPEWRAIALLSDENGIPKTEDGRLKVFDRISEKASDYGIAQDRLFFDPLTEALCLSDSGIETTVRTIKRIRERSSELHLLAAVANVSYQMPARRLLNHVFLVLAMNAGADSAILDPTDREMMGLIYAAEALLGEEEKSLDYIRAYRQGIIG